jgi:hypothetical protein
MNTQLYSFCLFLLWFGVAVAVFVFGSRLPYLGYGAAMLAMWNLVKWWHVRQYFKRRELEEGMREAYRRRTNPPREEGPKPVLRPEFQFDEEERHKIPPPPPPNGTAH